MRMLLAVPLVCLSVMTGCKPAWAQAEMLVQVCFSPVGECRNHILSALDHAVREVLVAMYAFTSVPLAQALIRARERGADVRVIVDAAFDARSTGNSVTALLSRHGIPVETLSGLRHGPMGEGLMHQKFVVVDNVTVASGSYNWTHSADNANYESLLIFRNAPSLAREFRAEFMRLWSK